jgi:glycosyltransferase involved in cell wall biosynthesis
MRRYLKLPLVKTGILPLGADMFKFGEKHYEPLKLLYIGTLNRRRIADTVYGFADFVERTSRGGTVKHTYDIIGTGSASEIDKLKSAIAETRMDNLIKYHGYKQYVEHEHFLSKCNTGVSYIPITAYYNHQPSTKTFEYILAGLICIGTGTCANKELINENNGVLCEDNAEGFSKALETLYEQRTKYDAHTVQETLKGYSWPNLVRNRVIPFFEEVMAATPAKR